MMKLTGFVALASLQATHTCAMVATRQKDAKALDSGSPYNNDGDNDPRKPRQLRETDIDLVSDQLRAAEIAKQKCRERDIDEELRIERMEREAAAAEAKKAFMPREDSKAESDVGLRAVVINDLFGLKSSDKLEAIDRVAMQKIFAAAALAAVLFLASVCILIANWAEADVPAWLMTMQPLLWLGFVLCMTRMAWHQHDSIFHEGVTWFIIIFVAGAAYCAVEAAYHNYDGDYVKGRMSQIALFVVSGFALLAMGGCGPDVKMLDGEFDEIFVCKSYIHAICGFISFIMLIPACVFFFDIYRQK